MGGKLALRRSLVALLFLLAGAGAVRANQAAQGWCESGAQVVITSGLTSTTTVQASYPACTVTVFVHGGGVATLYSDNNVFPTPLANPFTAATNGQWQFYVSNGRYDIQLSGAGFPTPVTYSDISLNDAGNGGVVFGVFASVPFSSTPVFNAATASIFSITLSGNVTSSTVNSPVQVGQVIEIFICQDGAGGHTWTWPANFSNTAQVTIASGGNSCTPTTWFFTGAGWQPFSGGGSITGIVQPAQGGTGSAAPAAHGVAVAEGAITPFNFILPTNNGQCLMSDPTNFATTDPSYQSCPTGTGGTSAGPQGTINAAGAVAGTFQTTGLLESNGALSNSDQNANRGPNPGVDITAPPFYARALSTSAIPLTTGTITGGTNTLVVANATGWQVNDGLSQVGGGATNCGSPPSAPTITPSLASSMPGTGHTVAGDTGSTSYSYVLIAISKGGCYTAAGAIGSTATGNATLGAANIPITSMVNVAGTVTATVGSTAALATGTYARIGGSTDDSEFGGYHNITVLNGTQFTYLSNISSIFPMFSTSATGGTLYFQVANHVALPALPTGTNMYKFAVYRCTGAPCALPANAANYSLVYISYPANLGFTDVSYNVWDDYGSVSALTSASTPWFVPTTPPSTNVNDMLVTTITPTGISGTTFTLAANATNSTTSLPVRFDVAPATTAAEIASNTVNPGGGGAIHIPPPLSASLFGTTCYVTSSYLVLSSLTNIGGILCPGETVEISNGGSGALRSGLFGTYEDTVHSSQAAFDNQTLLQWICLGANPCIWRKGPPIKNLSITTAGTGSMLVFDSSLNQTLTENVHFNTPDGMGIAYLAEESIFGGVWNNVGFTNGPSQVIGATAAPTYINRDSLQTTFNGVSGNLRGLYFECTNNAPNSCANYITIRMGNEWQGPITCLVTVNAVNGGRYGWIWLEHMIQDSGAEPIFCSASNSGANLSSLIINGTNQPGRDPAAPLGQGQPIVSGVINGGVSILTDAPGANTGMNHDLMKCPQSASNQVGYTGCVLPSLNLATATYGVSHTLTANEGIVKASASGITFTLPHVLAGQTWQIHNPTSGNIQLAIDSGTLSGNQATGSITIPANTSMIASCDGVNCSAVGLVKPYAGTGAGIVTGPTTSTNNDLVIYSGTLGQTADSLINLSNVALRNASNAFTTGTQDFSAVTAFRPKSGLTSALPATCSGPTPMDVYIATDAQPGRNWYFCTATNTWTQQLNSGFLGLNTYAAPHTLNINETWANFTASTTVTIPHAVVTNRWVVYCVSPCGTLTLAPDTGNITLNNVTAGTATVSTGLGVEVTCDGTNCFAWGLGGSGGGSGTVASCSVNGIAYYTAATTVNCTPAFSTPNGVPYILTSTPSGSATQPPALSLPGIVGRAVSGAATTDTILSTDCNPNRIEYVGSAAVAVTLPTATTLGVPKCVFKMVNTTSPAQTVTITPTTWTINGNATLALTFGQQLWLYVDPNSATNWVADQTDLFGNVSGAAVPASAKLLGSNSSSQLIAAALLNTHIYVGNGSNLPVDVAASGDVTLANTGAFTVTGANGGTFPTSASLLGTNASKQPIAATAHGIGLTLACADTSGSGSAQVCNTSPTFTPVAGDSIIYTTTTSSTGASLTINVNSLGAKPVAKWQTTTTLVANDVRANTEVLATYDGTNWELATVGNVPAGGGGGTPCTTTALSVQYNNAGAFGCMAEFTYATSTLTVSATGKLDLSASSVTAGFLLPKAAGAAPTNGGILSYDTTNNRMVLGNATNTSIIPWFTAAPTTNVLKKASGTLGLQVDSSITDNGTTVASPEPLVLGSANCTTFGTAGGLCMTEGTAPTNVSGAAALYPDSTAHELEVAMNGSTSFGMLRRSQPSPVNLTGQTALKTTTTLCAASAGACNVAGQYHISWNFWGSGTACSSVTAGSVQLQLTWTDENAVAHTAIAMPMWDQKSGALGTNFNFNTALGTEGASGDYTISTNGTVIQYATTYTACTTGTGTYNLRAAVERVQ